MVDKESLKAAVIEVIEKFFAEMDKVAHADALEAKAKKKAERKELEDKGYMSSAVGQALREAPVVEIPPEDIIEPEPEPKKSPKELALEKARAAKAAKKAALEAELAKIDEEEIIEEIEE